MRSASKQDGKLTKRKNNSFFYRYIYKYRFLHLLVLPGLIYFVIFKYIPMYGLIIAFKNYKGVGGVAGFFTADNVGLMHFTNFFSSIYFERLLKNTLILSFYKLTIGFLSPILLALLINEIRNTFFKRSVQTITYMPYFLSWVITAGLIKVLLSPDGGPLNTILNYFGKDTIFFVNEIKYFRTILVASDIWKNVGWGSIVYLAAIAGVDTTLYEAAKVDGANKFRQIWNITLPSIKNIISIMLILSIGQILNQNFDQIFNLYSAAVYEVSDVFDTYVYRYGIQGGQYSYTTAVGLFKSVISLILVVISNSIAKKMGSEGMW